MEIEMRAEQGTHDFRGSQTMNHDQRSVNFDQRSINVEQHAHGVNPELYTQMTVAAASAELRAQATQEVAGVREAAISAASDLRSEAVQAVANARVETTEAQAQTLGALAEIQRLQQQLEASQRENQLVREQFQQLLGHVQRENANETNNATGFVQVNFRLQSIETQLERLERKIDTHQEYIQELWMNQAPVPEVQRQGSQTPIVRLQDHDPGDDEVFGVPEYHEGSQAGSQANTNDLEGNSLRTKDLHHLKLPNLPDSASHFRTWKNSVRTVILSYDQSHEGHLTPWLNRAFHQLRGIEAEELRINSEAFPRMDRVLASVGSRVMLRHVKRKVFKYGVDLSSISFPGSLIPQRHLVPLRVAWNCFNFPPHKTV